MKKHIKSIWAICRIWLPGLLLGGCVSGMSLMPTPNLYVSGKGYPEQNIPDVQRSPHIDLLYVTDRLVEMNQGVARYGSGRSASMAFGTVSVDIGKGLTWPELLQISKSATRSRAIPVNVGQYVELGRFPEIPYTFNMVHGKPVIDPGVQASVEDMVRQFQATMRHRLAMSRRKDVVIFIHGFNNSFNDAAARLAEVWHFLRRQGVPLLYTWPSGAGGLYGYLRDRESAEYTIFHLKQTLAMLASMPEVKRIHIIAHSLGTHVITTALREMIIARRAAGENPHDSLRISNLILVAPDMDIGVVRQRLMAEQFGPAIDQITVYTAQTDLALEVSSYMMSGKRLGNLKSTDFDAKAKAIFASEKNVSFVNVLDASSFIGHSYFLDSPAASSDVIRVLEGNRPGSKNRPLIHKQGSFWELPADYPAMRHEK